MSASDGPKALSSPAARLRLRSRRKFRITMRRPEILYFNTAPRRRSRRVVWSLLSLGRGLFSLFAAWFPCVASIFRPCSIDTPHPLRTGRALLTHPAPSHHSPRFFSHYRGFIGIWQSDPLASEAAVKNDELHTDGNRPSLSYLPSGCDDASSGS